MVEERRERAPIKLDAYQQQLAQSFKKRVRERTFKVGDLVLRKVLPNTKDPNHDKLSSNCKGPNRVIAVGGT